MSSFFSFTVNSGAQAQVIRLVQQVLLSTEPFHYPTAILNNEVLNFINTCTKD